MTRLIIFEVHPLNATLTPPASITPGSENLYLNKIEVVKGRSEKKNEKRKEI